MKAESTEIFDLDILRHVYGCVGCVGSFVETLFPAEEFIQWLTYAHGDNLSVAEDLNETRVVFYTSWGYLRIGIKVLQMLYVFGGFTTHRKN